MGRINRVGFILLGEFIVIMGRLGFERPLFANAEVVTTILYNYIESEREYE